MATRARTRSATSPRPARAAWAIATGLRRGPLKLPRLAALGLGHAMRASTGRAPPGFALAQPRGQWGYGVETSRGKDTPSGHWELAGTPVDFDWGYFPETIPAFPEALTSALIAEAQASRDSRQSPRLGHGDHRGIRRGALKNGETHLLHLGRTRSSRSPRTRRPSGSNGSMNFAALRADCAIRSTSGASSLGRSSAEARRILFALHIARISRFPRRTAISCSGRRA